MEDLIGVTVWWLAFAVGGPVLIVAVMGPPLVVARGLVWLGMRSPGGLGRWCRVWEQRDPGALVSTLTCVQVLGTLVALWTGLLGRLLVLVSGG